MKITVGTSYFPVSADIEKNSRYILKHIKVAANRNADIVHFPECSISGYAGTDFESFVDYNWEILEKASRRILSAAYEHSVWIVLGSTHRLTGNRKPHNCVYIINPEGKIVDRYDKRFCGGPRSEKTGDLSHYTPGSHFSVFEIKGITCGVLICHDCRYPEIFRAYKQRGVELIFHSFHAGNMSQEYWKSAIEYVGRENLRLNRATSIPGIVFPATMQSMAANNYIWMSCSNSSRRESCFPGFMVRPDGVISGMLKRNVTGLLISSVDTEARLYDSTSAWRTRSIDGVLHSGTLVDDERSTERTRF